MLPEIPSLTRDITLRITFNPIQKRSPEYWDWAEILCENGILAISNITPPSTPADKDKLESIGAELTPRELHDLLYPSSLETPISPDPHDQLTFKVKRISYELGTRLAEYDPNREFFHIEFYPTLKPPHAELWERKAWDTSYTRKARIARYDNENNPTHTWQQRFASLMQRLTSYFMTITKLGRGDAEKAADSTIRSSNNDELLSVLRVPQDLQDEVTTVRNLMTELNEATRRYETLRAGIDATQQITTTSNPQPPTNEHTSNNGTINPAS